MTNSNQRTYDLRERSAKFGEAVIFFVKSIPLNIVTRPLISQIVRSATSVGANYAEADDAESKRDFRHKIAICRKESKETMYWFRIISSAEPTVREASSILLDEAEQLNRIFGASLKTLDKSD